MLAFRLLALTLSTLFSGVHGHVIKQHKLETDPIPLSTRAHWMRRAQNALVENGSPCQFAAFATAIVNHTDTTGLGELICTGVNSNSKTGNPIDHGEIVAISNCTDILRDPNGRNMTASQAQAAFADLSLYTNAESCPMCAGAIRWAGFKEYIYGTSIDTLVKIGWGQIKVSSSEIFAQSDDLGSTTSFMRDVLRNETDPAFTWQFDKSSPCPAGCARKTESSACKAV